MSKNNANHKNYLEIRPIINGLTQDKVRIPFNNFKKVGMGTKVKQSDRLFLLSEEYAQILEKYT